jgi:site-specific DNA-methyltransferase (adenine-specific)
MATLRLIHGDCSEVLANDPRHYTVAFGDPPDNIRLGYGEYKDKLPDAAYLDRMYVWLEACVRKADVVWWSFNARWTLEVGNIGMELRDAYQLQFKACQQTFTFGQDNQKDLKNNHRPLYRFMREGTVLYPDSIRVESWRLQNGDKRANPKGCVPGDVFEFTRVVGNDKERRRWHPTQLREALVERCIRLATTDGDSVLDTFGGTGTTLRVCGRLGRDCTLIELDPGYCERIAAENDLHKVRPRVWEKTISMLGAP